MPTIDQQLPDPGNDRMLSSADPIPMWLTRRLFDNIIEAFADLGIVATAAPCSFDLGELNRLVRGLEVDRSEKMFPFVAGVLTTVWDELDDDNFLESKLVSVLSSPVVATEVADRTLRYFRKKYHYADPAVTHIALLYRPTLLAYGVITEIPADRLLREMYRSSTTE